MYTCRKSLQIVSIFGVRVPAPPSEMWLREHLRGRGGDPSWTEYLHDRQVAPAFSPGVFAKPYLRGESGRNPASRYSRSRFPTP